MVGIPCLVFMNLHICICFICFSRFTLLLLSIHSSLNILVVSKLIVGTYVERSFLFLPPALLELRAAA